MGAEAKPPFLRRVRIRGYKSIAFCDVTLEPLTILVGRNGSGKSNFVDALAFLRDVVVHGASEAVSRHGGRESILHRGGKSKTVEIEVEVENGDLPGEEIIPWHGRFSITVEVPEKSAPRIFREHTFVKTPDMPVGISYTVESGNVKWDGERVLPAFTVWPNSDRVFLDVYSIPGITGLRERLRTIQAHNINPEVIRQPQKSLRGEPLGRDGMNLASVIESTREDEPWAIKRAGQHLSAIVPGVEFAGVLPIGAYEALRFNVTPEGATPTEVDASSMSDGTLRAFAALMATFQYFPPHGYPSFVAIEEPETALHPAAVQALMGAFDEATLRTQVLVTTHSPDLLESEFLTPEMVRVVRMIDGRTAIGVVDEVDVSLVRDHLATLGSLQRERRLRLEPDDIERQAELARAGPPS